jgi:transcriptional regulator with XRE-family HTH domain
MLNNFPSIIAGVSARLKEARRKLGLSQADMADLGQVSRSTQLSYETGQTAPTTDYLQVIQDGGADIPLVLYGQAAADHVRQSKINWASIQQAHEDVEFFCLRFAPNCPGSYRWQMVAQIYQIHQEKALRGDTPSQHSRQELLQEIWKTP